LKKNFYSFFNNLNWFKKIIKYIINRTNPTGWHKSIKISAANILQFFLKISKKKRSLRNYVTNDKNFDMNGKNSE